MYRTIHSKALSNVRGRFSVSISSIIERKKELSEIDSFRYNSDMDGDIVNEDRNGMMSTITRLGRIIATFSNTSGGQRVLVGFSQELINIFPVLVSMPDECQGLRVILEHTICRVADSGSRLDLFGRLSELIDYHS